VVADRRLGQVERVIEDERATTCCYAKQDKFWVEGAPDGEAREIYTVLEDSPTVYGDDAAAASRWGGAAAPCCGAAGSSGATAPSSCC
jgi:hypothetical protein